MSTGTGGGSRKSLKGNKSVSSKDHSGTMNVQTVMAPIKTVLTSTFKLAGPAPREESFENFLKLPDAHNRIKPKETLLFSTNIKKSKSENAQGDIEFCYKYEAPEVQAVSSKVSWFCHKSPFLLTSDNATFQPAITDNIHRPGFVPLSTAFHMQSNRERIGKDSTKAV